MDFSKIIIFLGIGSLVGYVLYLIPQIYSSKEPAYDWIPDKDGQMINKLIAENNKEGIELFIQVIKLYGSTASITRLGLSGLPLLTVVLTLIFRFLATLTWFVGLYVQTNPRAHNEFAIAIMDLAKLTLGAFIGSFVQRTVSERASEAKPQIPPGPMPPPPA